MDRPRLPLVALALSLISSPVAAEVVSVEIEGREVVLDGREWGPAGAYELVRGTLHFAFDPEAAANRAIVDLELAPRGADGRVELVSRFLVLKPVEVSRGSGTLLIEVMNRGGKASLSYFNGARGSLDPREAEHFGDGFLMRRGLSVLWVDWQFDVPDRPGLTRLEVPRAVGPDGPIEGLVRCDWTVDEPAERLELGHRGHVPYAVFDRAHVGNVLTVRSARLGERELVARKSWRFSEDGLSVELDGGFEAGRIYELVYRARDPAVVGLGLAVVRDAMSFAKYVADAVFPAERGLAVGISQTGRFLRHFLYQGFNTDEAGRKVFDGMLIHTAGAGRGSFNHRFAQPSRDAHRYSAFFYPTDLFPFSGRTQRDPVTGQSGGLLARLSSTGHAPRIFYTNTGYEYWGRAASLLHTSLFGTADVEPLPDERIYHLASAQHFTVGFPPDDRARITGQGQVPAWRGNPLDFKVTERALLAALQDWVEDDVDPPPSIYPRIEYGTLVPLESLRVPTMPGVGRPRVAHEAYRVDYGTGWEAGRISKQPPQLGPPFATLVPQVDVFGNELGGVPTVETLAPLASYLPWALRTNFPAARDELVDFYGTFVPLPATRETRIDGDQRPALSDQYPNRNDYIAKAATAANGLVERRFLLQEDFERVLTRAGTLWDWIHSR